MSTTPLPIPEFLPFLEVIQPENFIFCHTCKTAVWFNGLENHLHRQHKTGAKVRNPTMTYLKTIDVAATKADIPPRAHYSAPISFLPLLDGLSCNLCPYVTTTNPRNFRNHLHTAHTIKNPIAYQQQNGNLWTSVKLHTWYNLRLQGYQYWIVDSPANIPTSIPQPIEQRELSSAGDEDEQDWNIDGDHYIGQDGYERTEINAWLQRMGWVKRFDGRPMGLILATTYLPDKKNIEDRILGEWQEREIISCAEDEIKLGIMAGKFDEVVERALRTMQETPNLTRRWIKSYRSKTPFRKPLQELGKKETLQRYVQIWKRMLVYLFRIFQMDETDRVEIYGVTFRAKELDFMKRIWISLDDLRSIESRYFEYDPVADYMGNNTPSTEELLFGYCIELLTHEFNNGNPNQSLIINFTAVLGLRPQTRCFKTPRDYTSYLAGHLYLARLLILEFALPVQGYIYLDIPCRDEYENQVNRLKDIHERYLVRGSYNPIGEIIEQLAFGKALAKDMGPKPKLEWSLDKTRLKFEDQEMCMAEFQEYVKVMIIEVQQTVYELLPELDLAIDLSSLIDVMSIPDRGYYFGLHPDNKRQGMDKAYRRYIEYFSQPGPKQMCKNTRWDKAKVKQYITKADEFLERLWLCIHLTGGQPSRGSEIAPCKFKNTDILRNIVYYQGSLLLLFRYNKKANNDFWVARFLPYDVGCLLFIHLIYLRPFTHYLLRKTMTTFSASGSYIFANARLPNKCWNSRLLSEKLRETSQQHFKKMVFGLTMYRQMAVAISDEFIGKDIFNLTSASHNPKATALAAQTGHGIRLRKTNYGLQRGYPTGLQPQLLDMYFDISIDWHRWLGLETLQRRKTKEIELMDEEDEEPPRKRIQR